MAWPLGAVGTRREWAGRGLLPRHSVVVRSLAADGGGPLPHFTVYLWDMPGYGESSKHPEHRVSLDVQGELFGDLLGFWELRSPHVVAHDYGGAVALRGHLLHGSAFASLALVDVVALRPWGSDFFRLVRDHVEVFSALPSAVMRVRLRAYISGASHRGLTPVLWTR